MSDTSPREVGLGCVTEHEPENRSVKRIPSWILFRFLLKFLPWLSLVMTYDLEA